MASPKNNSRSSRTARGRSAAGALLLRDARPLGAFSVGLFNGFVPCALVYGMAA